MKILVINAGSSSIKYQLFDMPGWTILAKGMVERIGEADATLVHKYNGSSHMAQVDAADHEAAMSVILSTLTDAKIGAVNDISEIQAVGHRVVHGGEEFTGSVLIDEHVIAVSRKNLPHKRADGLHPLARLAADTNRNINCHEGILLFWMKFGS